MNKHEELKLRTKNSNLRVSQAEMNIDSLAEEAIRVSDVALNAPQIIDNLEKEFEEKTGLHGKDIPFLMVAIALQCIRIYVINAALQREKATRMQNEDGSSTLESKIDEIENKLLGKFDNGDVLQEEPTDFYAPLNQIIGSVKVPYDATRLSEKDTGFFQGANHRFSTLGHDPLLGLIFGTANILTNTITITKELVPGIYTERVSYTAVPLKKGGLKIKSPVIQYSGSSFIQAANTAIMFRAFEQRIKTDRKAVAAAFIKQICHIGTDMFTVAGLPFPTAGLILTPAQSEKIAKCIDTGTLTKSGPSVGIAAVINTIISLLHGLLFNEEKDDSIELYSIRTRKIIFYSNLIATGSNFIQVAIRASAGEEFALRQLDIAGMMVIIHKIAEDQSYIREIKHEFIRNKFFNEIIGEEL